LSEAGWAAALAHGVRTVADLRDAGECEPDLYFPAMLADISLRCWPSTRRE
jgi:hypothetical protein